MRTGNYGDGYGATFTTPGQKMAAFDALPKLVRRMLSMALLDYTAIDFLDAKRAGWSEKELIDQLKYAQKRDHIRLAAIGRVAEHPETLLKSADFSLSSDSQSDHNSDLARRECGSTPAIHVLRAARAANRARRLQRWWQARQARLP